VNALTNTNAERLLVSAMLEQPDLQAVYLPLLEPGAITDPACGSIVGIMRDAGNGGLTQDMLLACIDERLPDRADAVVSIIRAGGLPFKAPFYYRQICHAKSARDWQCCLAEHVQQATDIASTLETVDAVGARLEELRSALANVTGDADRERADEIAAAVETGAQGKVALGIACGLPALDCLIRGLRPGEVIIVCARPGYGKSALAIQVAVALADEALPVAFYSAEMPPRDVWGRVLRLKWPNGVEPAASVTVKQYLTALPLSVADASRLNVGQLAADIGRRAAVGLKLAVVDYLQIIAPPALGRGANREAEVAAISRTLQQCAMRNRLPIIVLAQLNRQAVAGPPRLAHLRESGAVEQDASVGIIIDRVKADGDDRQPDHGKPIECTLNVEKNRNGPTGVAEVLFYPAEGRFEGRRAAENAEPTRPPPPADRAWYAKEE
jgi:replicative DNA helicase